MLCTLGMLSNQSISEYTRIVPVQTIIFDEASQIEVGDYLPMLHRFQPSLQKIVFIGDDKQCETLFVIPWNCITDLYDSGTTWPR